MAQEQNKNQQLKRLNKLIAGMNTDADPIDQPPGTYRFAYNATSNREIGALSSERGTEIFTNLPSGFLIVLLFSKAWCLRKSSNLIGLPSLPTTIASMY